MRVTHSLWHRRRESHGLQPAQSEATRVLRPPLEPTDRTPGAEPPDWIVRLNSAPGTRGWGCGGGPGRGIKSGPEPPRGPGGPPTVPPLPFWPPSRRPQSRPLQVPPTPQTLGSQAPPRPDAAPPARAAQQGAFRVQGATEEVRVTAGLRPREGGRDDLGGGGESLQEGDLEGAEVTWEGQVTSGGDLGGEGVT